MCEDMKSESEKYSFVGFGALRNVSWPYKTSKIGDVRIFRVDMLPKRVRQHVDDQFLERSLTGINMPDIERYDYLSQQRTKSHHVLKYGNLFGGLHRRMADPIRTTHFVVARCEGPLSEADLGQELAWKRLTEVLTSIRLVGGQDVSFVFPAVDLKGVGGIENGLGFQTNEHPELESPGFNPKTTRITKSEVSLIKKTTNQLTNHPELNIVCTRFNLGIGKPSKNDALLDLVVGLEALYLPDVGGELSYRLRMRCSRHLGESVTEIHEIFSKLNDLYKMRSKLVHGDALTIEQAAEKTAFKETPVQALEFAFSILSRGLLRVLKDEKDWSDSGRGQYFDSFVLS